MTTVAIIDDHAVVRMGLKYILSTRKSEFAFVGEWQGGEGAVAFVERTAPDVVLLDIQMPDKDGLTVLEEMLAARPDQKVLMLTTSEADNDVYRALTMGARGYLLKDRDATEIHRAIRTVANGQRFIPPAVMELFRRRQMMQPFTPREMQVLLQLRDGCTNEAIADRLGVTKDAIKLHIRNIYVKLGVSDRVSAVREASRRGFLR